MLTKKIDDHKLYSLFIFPGIVLLLFILKSNSVTLQEIFKLMVTYYTTLLIGNVVIYKLNLEDIILKITSYKIIKIVIIILVIILYEIISSNFDFTYISCYLGTVSSFLKYFNMS